MAAIFDTSFIGGDAIFDTSFADEAPVAMTLVTDIDAGNVSAGSTTITDADTAEPTVNLAHRTDAGDWRHLHFAVENAAGKRPIFKAPRTTRYNNATPGTEYRPVWTQDFVTWTRAPSRTLTGGTSGTIDWQFTDPLPAGRVYIATQPLGRQADAVALTTHLLTAHASVASPTASAGAGGVFFTSPAETDGIGRAVGGNPMYAIDLKFGGSTTDGGPKRKLVMISGIHAAGEQTCWISFMHCLDFILNSSAAAAVALRANWDISLYYNITPNGIVSGDNRTNPSRSDDPNRIWHTPNVEIAATQAAIIADLDGGRFDAFFSWHGWSSTPTTSPFLGWLSPTQYALGTRSAATQAFIDAGTTIFGIAPTFDTSGTSTTDVWWAESQGAVISFDAETQQNGTTDPAAYQLTGESWAKTLQAVDADGLFWESSGASGELHATISDVTATLAGTAGVSGELHATVSDVTATLEGMAGGAGVSGELHGTVSDVVATFEGLTEASVLRLNALLREFPPSTALFAGTVEVIVLSTPAPRSLVYQAEGISISEGALEITGAAFSTLGEIFDVVIIESNTVRGVFQATVVEP